MKYGYPSILTFEMPNWYNTASWVGALTPRPETVNLIMIANKTLMRISHLWPPPDPLQNVSIGAHSNPEDQILPYIVTELI